VEAFVAALCSRCERSQLPNDSTASPLDEIEAVRRLVLFARNAPPLRLSRHEIANVAEIRATDLDNFTTIDSNTGRYKTSKPHPRVLSRLLQFVVTDHRIRTAAVGHSEHERLLDQLTQTYQSLRTFSADDDYFFLHLKSIHAMDDTKCRSICKDLSGNYYGYRFARKRNQVVRSYFEIQKYDPARKLPTFKHHLKYENGIPRFTRGQILDIGANYIFTGFVESGTYDFEGVKFIVAEKGSFGDTSSVSGLFISCASKTEHQMGFIQLTRTADRYDEQKLGIFSIEAVAAQDRRFNLSSIRKNVTDLLENGLLVASLSSDLS
jgi:hypothetical protein